MHAHSKAFKKKSHFCFTSRKRVVVADGCDGERESISSELCRYNGIFSMKNTLKNKKKKKNRLGLGLNQGPSG